MSYVKFNEKNISTQWSATEQEGDGWYEVPTEHEGHNFYQLKDGEVVPLSTENLENFHLNRFRASRQGRVRLTIRQILNNTDWLVQRHTEQVSLGTETSLSDLEYQNLIEYRADLRSLANEDLTAEDFDPPVYPLKERNPIIFVDELESLSKLSPEGIID